MLEFWRQSREGILYYPGIYEDIVDKSINFKKHKLFQLYTFFTLSALAV